MDKCRYGSTCTEGTEQPELGPTNISVSTIIDENTSTQINGLKSTEKPTVSQLNDPIIHINGSISTKEFIAADFDSDKENFEDEIKTEIKKLLVSNAMVVNALVSINEMEKIVSANRKKRSSENFVIGFNAACSLGVEENLTKIEVSIIASIKKADPSLYDFFDEKSFATIHLTFETPDKIGKIR